MIRIRARSTWVRDLPWIHPLGVGAYRTDEGKPYYFPVVRKAEERILADPTANKEYLPIDGLPKFRELASKFLLGDDHPAIVEKRVCTVQSLSGTGALRLGAEFISKFMKGRKVYLPNPTWGNHNAIFTEVGMEIVQYRWYKAETCSLDFEGLKEDMMNAPEGSIFLLHTCAHNPTGVDPTPDQWNEIADICMSKKLVPFFDTAYQGFASGDLVRDGYSVRMFASKGLELLAAQSFAKNMGLYGERIGSFIVVCKDAETVTHIQSQMKIIVRKMYSNPPMHGAKIVATILGDAELRAEWQQELKAIVARILTMRQSLYDALRANGCPGAWEHIIKQIGMFSFTGLDPEQSDRMLNLHHIYMLRTGRISLAGLTSDRVQYVADCIKEVVEWKLNGKKCSVCLTMDGWRSR
mgnify:FL=1